MDDVLADLAAALTVGISTGSLYGVASAGLVLTYKTSGIFNFAHGALAAASAYFFHELRTVQEIHWSIALLVTVFVFAPLLGLGVELIARRLEHTDSARRIVATIGLLLLIQGIAALLYGVVPLPFPAFISTATFAIGDVFIGWDQVFTVVVSAACIVGLFVFFRRSRLGLEMRGVVDNAELLGLTGSNPTLVRRTSWAIGSAFAGLSGVLLATTIGLDASRLTLVVVTAFGAAAIGRFRNIGVTFVAAIVLQVVIESMKNFIPGTSFLSGLPASMPFLVLFAMLAFSRPGTFEAVEHRARPRPTLALSFRTKVVSGAILVTLVALVPSLVGTRLTIFSNAAIFVVIYVSLSLLVRLSNQVSLCQMSFAALGATTFAHLSTGAGLPWLLAFVLAGLAVVPVGALLAIPAIRLSPLYLGLATFGFAILMEQFLFRTSLMFGFGDTVRAARPGVLGLDSDAGFFYLCAAIAIACLLATVRISRSRLGRLLRGMADSPVAMRTQGADVNITRVLIFCISAFMAGIAGALLVTLTGVARPGVTFSFFQSLLLLAVLTLAGRSLVAAPVIATLIAVVLPSYVSSPNSSAVQQLAFGLAALVVVTLGPLATDTLKRIGAQSVWRLRSSPVTARGVEQPAVTVGVSP